MPPVSPRQVPFRLAFGLLLAALFTGGLALGWGLKPPLSHVMIAGLVMGWSLLGLARFPGAPRQGGRWLGRNLLRPVSLSVRALGAFYRTEPPVRSSTSYLPPLVAGIFSLALTAGLLLTLLLLSESLLAAALLAVITAGIGLSGRLLGADSLAVPRLLGRLLRGVVTEERCELPQMRWWQIALELLVVLALALVATRRFYTAPPELQISGFEAEWLTNSVYAAHNGLREYGRIPLWQPLLEMGEPLLDNPFGMVLNPFSSGPSLLVGGAAGLKYSVVILVALAGVGGWFLGWVLGLSWPGRLLLGGLLIGKGNMQAMFNTGYFQLAAQQVYFPWLIGGFLALFRVRQQRWPVVLTALAFTLMYFTGNLWYLLPMLITMAALTLVYLVKPGERRVDWPGLRRVALAGALTVGLSAVVLLPMALQWERLGKHPPEALAGTQTALWRYVVPLYFNPQLTNPTLAYDPRYELVRELFRFEVAQFYYSYVLPLWFVMLLVALPLYRPRQTQARRFWLIAWGLVVLFTLWGAGGEPLWLWLYDHLEFLRGWRFVGRALAVASFFLAVLAALRVDSLWQSLRAPQWAQLFPAGSRLAHRLPLVLTALLLGGSGLAAWQVSTPWNTDYIDILNPIYEDDVCISWLRQQYPTQELAVWRWGYNAITTYLNNRVRASEIYADFEMTPRPSTIGKADLTLALPEFGIASEYNERGYLLDRGYRTMAGSPLFPETAIPCLYHKPEALSYAYTVALVDLLRNDPKENTLDADFLSLQEAAAPELITLPPAKTTPITRFLRQPDNVLLFVPASAAAGFTILTVQERAYPGWEVTVDGQPAKLESVGGQIGVLLPRDHQEHVVYFVYRPPLLFRGAVVTLLTIVGCCLYLLRADRLFRRKRG